MPTRAFFGLFGAVGSMFSQLLADGTPLRVGIEVGIGAELRFDSHLPAESSIENMKNSTAQPELHGPVLAKAYALESEVAQYPRIVVGNEALNYLNLAANQSADPSSYVAISAEVAQMCLNMLVRDDDGHWVLDYFGGAFKKYVYPKQPKSNGLNGQKILEKCLDFASAEHERFAEEQNSKLAFRYANLTNYLISRLGVWFSAIEQDGIMKRLIGVEHR